ncbi:MAG: hypothetical protein AB7Y46_00725 [Armatimonadota bacterium]
MEKMRIFVKTDVPETALAALSELPGVEAGDGLIIGVGEPRPGESSLLLFYEAEGGKGEIRIPFSSIAFADEGVHRAAMKRTLG